MANFKFVKSATALVLGASVLTSAVVVPGANASAKTTYKVNKNGTLVNAKTNKTVKGYVSYKGKLYKDGKKFTGLYNKKYYYKSGVKATGTYKGAYYVKGAKKVTTGTYNGKYYVKGALYTGKTSKNVYYVKGVKFTGVTKYGYTYKDGKRVEGEYQGKVYTNGKLVTGLYKDKLYKAGELVKGFALEKEKLYKDGVLNIGLALFQDKLYNDADLNKGLKKYEDKFYFDADLADGTYDDNGVERAIEKGVEVGAKVKSVEAINATQVKVTFNKSVDKDTAEDETNYKLNDVALADGTTAAATPAQAKAELQADKKVVILTLADAKANDTAFSIKVDGVKDVAGTVIKSEAFKVLVNDTTAPEVSKVEFDGTNVVYTFSEPLKNDKTSVIARVAGTPVDTATVTISGNTVTVPATIAKGATASLYLTGVKDTAGNEIAPYNGSVTAPNDTVAPTITSLTQISQTKVRVVFSEPVTGFATGDLKVLKGSVLSSTSAISQNLTVDETGKTYDVTVDANDSAAGDGIYDTNATSQVLTFIVDAEAFTDVAGNKNAAYSKQLTLTKDATAPVYVSSKVSTDGSKLQLTYGEDLKSGITPTVVVTNANGVRLPATAAVNGSDSKVLDVTLTGVSSVAAGTYTIKVTGVSDEYDNVTATHTATVTVGDSKDTTKPVAVISNSATNKFQVAYGEEVTSSALSASNYTLDGAALPAGTDIYFTDSDKDTVEIALPDNSVNIGVVGTGTSALLKVSNVADLAGNIVDATSKNVTIEDNTAAKVANIQVVGTDVYVTFDEKITVPATTNAATIFTIKDGTTALASTDVSDVTAVTGNAKQLKFTLNAAPTGTISATILSSQTALTDANGYVVK